MCRNGNDFDKVNNSRPATCSLHYNLKPTTYNLQHIAHNLQLASFNITFAAWQELWHLTMVPSALALR